MACGPVSGVVVLDFDGPVGIETLKQLRDEGKLPQTWTATTPRGGIHLYYAISNGCTIKNGVRVLPGMDIKAHGGYVLVPSAFKACRRHALLAGWFS
jgi:hypothetical protein